MAKKEKKEEERKKCYACRKELPVGDRSIFCKKCEKDPKSRVHTSGVLIIYNK